MKKLLYIFGLATLAACKPNLKPETPSAAGLDFSRYLAMGNSLTAGYADGSLYRSGQINSYPAILASQFGFFGKYEFRQPLLPGESGWPINTSSPNPMLWRTPKMVLGYTTDCQGNTGLGPTAFSGVPDTAGSSINIGTEGPFNNFGIPFIRTIDYLTPGYALGANALGGLPWALRMFANPFATPLQEALRLNPTFFTLWLGNNDVLGYAISGGEGDADPLSPFNISDVNTFRMVYDSVVSAVTANGAKGAVLNIPDVTSIPFFTTIPFNGLMLDSLQALQLNGLYQGSGMQFQAGANAFVIQDVSLPSGRRQLKAGELVLLSLSQDSLKCAGWGTVKPIPEQFVLTQDELTRIAAATLAFNTIIHDVALLNNLPVVDMNAYLRTAVTGIKYNGVTFNTQYLSGGAFSLDGIHLTPRGYALVANEIIRVVNAYYKSTIPAVDANAYSGIRFPL